jgi:hypothetical protein
MASAREIHCASSLGDFRGSPIGMAGRQQCSSAFLMEEHDARLDRCCGLAFAMDGATIVHDDGRGGVVSRRCESAMLYER